jgi:ribonuclease HII
MVYVIGTDEAGYGPNYGPLVIAGTVWQLPPARGGEALSETLAHAIAPRPGETDRLPLADSKSLYQPAHGIGTLERGLLAALEVCYGAHDTRWRNGRELWRALAPRSADALDREPWCGHFELPIPRAVLADEVRRTAQVLAERLAEAECQLTTMRATAIFPSRFNDEVERWNGKATALSVNTLELVRSLIEQLPPAPVYVWCDRHGGRAHYQSLLQRMFPETLVEVRSESARVSVYAWGPAARRVEIRFVVGGESLLPAALASMTAKYLRELAMEGFNRFWRSHVPDLRPTAGYPVDARRFRDDIRDAQRQLGIDDRVLWRSR